MVHVYTPHPRLRVGCFNTWASAGVKRSVMCANVCVFQTVNAPQKNKVSFHQTPILHIIHQTYKVFIFLLNLWLNGKHVLRLMSDISHGENWIKRDLGPSLQWACLRLKGVRQGRRGTVHRSHCHHPSQLTLHPHRCGPTCGSDHTLPHDACTDSAVSTQLTAPRYQGKYFRAIRFLFAL